MRGRAHIEGDNFIQSPEVSSSSDVLNSRLFLNNNAFRTFPRRRCSYRTRPFPQSCLEYHHPLAHINLNNDMAFPPILPRVPVENGTCKRFSNLSTRAAVLSVAIIFLSSIFALSLVYRSFPKLKPYDTYVRAIPYQINRLPDITSSDFDEILCEGQSKDEKQYIKIPWNIEDAKSLGIVLNRYKKDHYYSVLSGVFLSYVFLQTFAIPGSLFLSILSGFLFNFYTALVLVCTCSALGASLCFLLSQLLGRRLIWIYFPEKAKEWAMIVNKHRENLLNYIIFLRVTPFLPNWFINLTAPVIGVPLVPFAVGTFLGVAPPSFVAIQAGQTLHDMSADDSAFSWTSIFWLGVFAVVSLIPIFLKKQLKEKFQ